MLGWLQRFLMRFVGGRRAVALGGVVVALMVLIWVFGPKPSPFSEAYSAFFGFDCESLDRLFTPWGKAGRMALVRVLLTYDMLLPLVYSTLLAGLLARVVGGGWARWLMLAPFLAAGADWGENLLLVKAAFENDPTGRAVGVAAHFTQSKWFFLLLSILALTVLRLRRASPSRSDEAA